MRILITGVTGQIGWYAAEQALVAGHEVFGLVRGQGTADVPQGVQVLRGDLTDQASLIHAVREAKPDHVYNFGAFTSIGMSWAQPELCMDVTGTGVLRLLEAVRLEAPEARVVQASSADQFGEGYELTLRSPFKPRSPYAVAKQAAHDYCQTYRKAYGMHVSCAVQFNAVSPRLREEFFLRKVTKSAARIACGLQETLFVGDLSPLRELGYAPDVAAAYPLIAQYAENHGARDWSLATGAGWRLAEIVAQVFPLLGVSPDEGAVKAHRLNYSRPADVKVRVGSRSVQTGSMLGWAPTKSGVSVLHEMAVHDLREARRERAEIRRAKRDAES